MRSTEARGLWRPLVALTLTAVLAYAAAACADRDEPQEKGPREAAALAARPTLDSPGSRYAGESIPITGSADGLAPTQAHRLALQMSTTSRDRWSTVAEQDVVEGAYRFPDQHAASPGTTRFRTVLDPGSSHVVESNVVTVDVVGLPAIPPACRRTPSPSTCPQPPTITEQRVVEATSCPTLTVKTQAESGVVRWQWAATPGRWVRSVAWVSVPGSKEERAATTADCVKVVDRVPRGAALPDLRIKDLTRCGRGDALATHGTCFKIVPSAPYDPDFPQLQGKKLLKFGVITMNAGPGPAEIVAERPDTGATTWQAYQDFYDARGHLLGSVVEPSGVQFYYAGDGHEHWHVRDFDEYDLLDASGTAVARAEKHGYCMEDDTTYDPTQGRPGVEAAATYEEDTSCGEKLQAALTIVHGLSRGWGDTYPTSLPDQAIDITGVPDGVYTVRVHADAVGAVQETDETNNVAQVRVRISGDTVHVLPGTSTGGLP